jgi:hypothetical protein
MGLFKDMFSSPKLPKVQPLPAPVEDQSEVISQAQRDAIKGARMRLGSLAMVYSGGGAARGVTGTPRTAAGGLTGQ